MQCPHSKDWYVGPNGKLTPNIRLARQPVQTITLPCNQCLPCRVRKTTEWATRGKMECKMAGYDNCCFLTLTVRPEVWESGVKTTRDLQPLHRNFMKGLRDSLGRDRVKVGLDPIRIRNIAGFEYGEDDWRVHAHVIIIGSDLFRDEWRLQGVSEKGHELFTTERLERLWPHGFHTIQPVTDKLIGYQTRHMVRKITGPAAKDHYTRFFPETGEVVELTPEFSTRSQGIGRSFFEKFPNDVYNPKGFRLGDRVVSVPKYFDNLMRLRGRDGHVASSVAELKADRLRDDVNALTPHLEKRLAFLESPQAVYNNSPERLAVRAESLDLRVNRRKREGR